MSRLDRPPRDPHLSPAEKAWLADWEMWFVKKDGPEPKLIDYLRRKP